MDPILLIIIIAGAILLLGGTAFAFARGRGDHTPTLEPTARDSVDAGGSTAVLERDSATDELVDVDVEDLSLIHI